MRLAHPCTLAAAVSTGVVVGIAPLAASGYELHIEATSIGQGYQVRWLRFSERDRWLNRRRFTQTLRLDVWDILAPAYDPAYPDRPRTAPADLYFTSSLRLDHDFGDYTTGTVLHDDAGASERDPARALVPELEEDTLQLDVPYAYLGGRRLGGWLDFRLGRQLEVQTFDWYSFDGLALTAHTPFYFAVLAHGGLLVRSDSAWGSPTHEPDGTASGDCRRVETGGSTWIPTDDCAQRKALMPGFGVALESEGLRHLRARVAYRRAQSPTQDVYPARAPAWGVNEEKLVVDLRGDLLGGGLQPFVAARYNFVLGQADEAEAGMRLGWAEHGLTPEAAYSYPSFDADSIFNVFASEPYTDLRLGYDMWPGRGPLRAWARGFWRRFSNSTDGLAAGEQVASSASATGVDLGAQLRFERGRVRLVGFHDVGFGGVRVGGDLLGSAWLRSDLQAEGRMTVVDFHEPLTDERGVTFGLQAGARWLLHEGVVLHFIAEENSSRFDRSQFRLIAIMDLAFRPEP